MVSVGGIDARMVPDAAEVKSGACFASHVRYDIVVGAAKLAGAAQRRTQWGLLHQGSIQLHGARQATSDLANVFATHVRPTNITSDLLQAAHLIAQQKYA